MSKYSTIIFDLDGTLIDTLDDITDAINITLDEVKFEKKIDNSVVKNIIGNGARVLMERLFNLLDLSSQQERLFEEKYFFNYSSRVNIKSKPFKGVVDTLKILKEKNYLLGVITNKPDEDARKCINYYFGDLFDFVVGKKENIQPKPHKEVFEQIELLKNVDKNKIVYVGDMDIDIIFSKNIGVDVVICKHGYGKYDEMDQYNYLIDSFSDLINIME